jgi:hypothetical protein
LTSVVQTSGFGANPVATSYAFLAAPATVTIAAGQKISVTSSKALGSSLAAGAHNLNLDICRAPSGGTPVSTSGLGGEFGLGVSQGERIPFTLTAVFSGLPAGTYLVGHCGETSTSTDASAWNSNEFSYTTAMVLS